MVVAAIFSTSSGILRHSRRPNEHPRCPSVFPKSPENVPETQKMGPNLETQQIWTKTM